MNEIQVDTMEVLIEGLNSLPNHYIYRGQADATWGLQSTLERTVGANWSSETAQRFEDFSLMKFRSKYHLYGREALIPDSKLAWLAVMQHHGVPTRLVDFTESPYVGLYFALETFSPSMMSEFAIYAVDYTAVMERATEVIREKDKGFRETRETLRDKQDETFDSIVDCFSCDVLWVTEPQVVNTRLDLQSGSFLLSGNRAKKIESILESPEYHDVDVRKYCIPGEFYQNAFRLLQKMNITSKSLYGDVDGLARSIKMEMQIYAV